MVGFAIAELLPDFKAEIISFFVDPNCRQQGIGTKMMAFLEQELLTQKCQELALIYHPTLLTEQGLEIILGKLGWQQAQATTQGLKVAQKLLPIRSNIAVNEAARVQFDTGNEQLKSKELENAIILFQAAIRLQPDYFAAHNQLGNALQQLGRLEEAITAYQQVLQINPNIAATHCNLGSIWQNQGNIEAAISAYQRAIQIKPNFVLAYHHLGNLYASQQQMQKAEYCFTQALRLQKSDKV